MIRLNQLKLPVDHTREQLIHKTAQYLRIPAADILELQIPVSYTDRKAVSGCQKKAGTFLQLQCECNGEKGRKSI